MGFFQDFPGVCAKSGKFKDFQVLRKVKRNSRGLQDFHDQYIPCIDEGVMTTTDQFSVSYIDMGAYYTDSQCDVLAHRVPTHVK